MIRLRFDGRRVSVAYISNTYVYIVGAKRQFTASRQLDTHEDLSSRIVFQCTFLGNSLVMPFPKYRVASCWQQLRLGNRMEICGWSGPE